LLLLFPVLRDAQIVPTRSDGTRRAKIQRRLLWLTFLGKARKVSGYRATSGLALQRAIDLHNKNEATMTHKGGHEDSLG